MADPVSYPNCESDNYILSFNYYAVESHERKMALICKPLARGQKGWRLRLIGDNEPHVFITLNKFV